MRREEERSAERREAEAWRRAYRDTLPPGSHACPPDEALAALALGEPTGEARLELADHLVACRRCADAFRALVELDEAAGDAARAPAAGSPRRWRIAGWAAAASVLLAVGLAVVELPRRQGGDAVVRGAGETQALVRPAHGARLSSPPQRLAWGVQEAGASYRVVLYDAESVPIWESEPTAGREVPLPGAVRARLARGGTFYWRVRIESERGRRATALYRFETMP